MELSGLPTDHECQMDNWPPITYPLGIGACLELQPSIDSDINHGEFRLSVKITAHLKVGPRRRSQVVLATVESTFPGSDRTTPPPPGTPVVLKVFDPQLIAFGDGEWEGSPLSYCEHLNSNEIRAYTKLISLAGREVPTFYGGYKFGDAFVILTEYITRPSLLDYHVQSLEEAETLRKAGHSLVQALHSNGVYHSDLEPFNLFRGISPGLKVLDFEFAKFKENGSDESIHMWKRKDIGELDRILVDCGVPDTRPPPPSWMKPAAIRNRSCNN
jgi:serine/threonine protein kinase